MKVAICKQTNVNRYFWQQIKFDSTIYFFQIIYFKNPIVWLYFIFHF